MVERGFTVKSVKLWSGHEDSMNPKTSEFIRDTTLQLEDEIHGWMKEQSS
jgi:hypothetical protein